jgi:fructose-1,6-bisphosphatase/inositol monophosphatase family enzyme
MDSLRELDSAGRRPAVPKATTLTAESCRGLILGRVRGIHRYGSAALHLWRVATGHLDASWEIDGFWNYEPGNLMVERLVQGGVLAGDTVIRTRSRD